MGSGYSSVWDQDAKREQGAAKTRCIYDTGCVFCWCYVCWPMKHPETSVFDRSMSLVQYHPGGKCNDRLGFICTRYNLNTPVTCFVSKPSTCINSRNRSFFATSCMFVSIHIYFDRSCYFVHAARQSAITTLLDNQLGTECQPQHDFKPHLRRHHGLRTHTHAHIIRIVS